jgi:hypothetical protein
MTLPMYSFWYSVGSTGCGHPPCQMEMPQRYAVLFGCALGPGHMRNTARAGEGGHV